MDTIGGHENAHALNLNLQMDSTPRLYVPPVRDKSKPLIERAFCQAIDIQMQYDRTRPPLVMDFVTTEQALGATIDTVAQVLGTNRRANRILLDSFDRLTKKGPAIVDFIYKQQENYPKRKGVVLYAHGGDFTVYDAPFGIAVSRYAANGEQRIVPAELVVQGLDKPEIYSYMLLLACNTAKHSIDKAISSIPIIYYLSNNTSTSDNLGNPVIAGFEHASILPKTLQ